MKTPAFTVRTFQFWSSREKITALFSIKHLWVLCPFFVLQFRKDFESLVPYNDTFLEKFRILNQLRRATTLQNLPCKNEGACRALGNLCSVWITILNAPLCEMHVLYKNHNVECTTLMNKTHQKSEGALQQH